MLWFISVRTDVLGKFRVTSLNSINGGAVSAQVQVACCARPGEAAHPNADKVKLQHSSQCFSFLSHKM